MALLTNRVRGVQHNDRIRRIQQDDRIRRVLQDGRSSTCATKTVDSRIHVSTPFSPHARCWLRSLLPTPLGRLDQLITYGEHLMIRCRPVCSALEDRPPTRTTVQPTAEKAPAALRQRLHSLSPQNTGATVSKTLPLSNRSWDTFFLCRKSTFFSTKRQRLGSRLQHRAPIQLMAAG
jgi:hypothetical protein